MLRFFGLFAAFLPAMLFAQQKECVFVDWSHHYGGTKSDAANDVQSTTDGGFIVAGYSRSLDEDLTGNKGASDYWVVKLDSLGGLQWQQNYGGLDNDIATAILQTDDGGYIVAGGTVSFDGQVSGNHGAEDAWVLRLDDLGNILWKKTYGGTLNDRAESIHPTSDGGFILSGYSQSDDGDLTSNHGEFDYWIFKIAANGNLVWQKSLGGGLSEYAFDAIETSDGGFLAVGSSFSNDGDVSGNQGFYDYWVVKLTGSGSLSWAKSFGGIGEERAYAVTLTTGGFLVAGTSNSVTGNVSGNNGGYDYWVTKISDTGVLLWSKNFGGSVEDRAQGIFGKADGGAIVCGLSGSSNADVGGNFGSKDGWLINLDANGQLLWEKNFGGSLDDRFSAVLSLNNGGFACAGFASSNDHDLDGNYGEQDMWVIRLSPDSIQIDLGQDTILCAGQGLILNAELPNVSYQWPDGSSLPIFLVSSPGEYWVEIDKQGCKSRDSIVVDYVSETPVNIGNDTVLCEGETLLLDPGIAGANILWKNGSTDPEFPVNLPGEYWVEVSKDGCEYRDTINVDFTTVPFELGKDLTLCAGETKTFEISLNNAVFEWQDGSTAPSYVADTPGLVWAKVTQGGCVRVDSVEISYQIGPLDPLPDYSFICENEGLWLNAEFDGATYLWQNGSTNHNFKAVTPGNYSVQIQVGDCIFEDEVELRSCELCLYIPNIFSPNGDGINDIFTGFPGCDISNYHQQVFDRWGEKVFESNTTGIGWDGEKHGKAAQQGVYAYRIEFDYLNNGELEHQLRIGTVTLFR
ncbi:MAG: T9SS type B sorting domain-containing protein [Bacteroidetes bacterium]|nr:T9SS type B sorting domain-containing protein [Bacteroidota bacterium]